MDSVLDVAELRPGLQADGRAGWVSLQVQPREIVALVGATARERALLNTITGVVAAVFFGAWGRSFDNVLIQRAADARHRPDGNRAWCRNGSAVRHDVGGGETS